jgi:hypothetical protein
MENSDNSGESVTEHASESLRESWGLMERIADLETQLAEREERDRIRELEITALRHELELRFAYNGALEEALEEQRNINRITALFESERIRADQAEQLLAAERTRISYRIVNRVLSPMVHLSRRVR